MVVGIGATGVGTKIMSVELHLQYTHIHMIADSRVLFCLSMMTDGSFHSYLVQVTVLLQ